MSFALERRDDDRFRAAQVELIRTAATASRSPARPVARRGHLLPRGAGTAAALLVVVAFGASLALIGSRWPVPAWAAALYAALSIACFLVYAADKSAAVAGRWRISENTLLALGLLGGWPGALLAQQVLRHKLRKRRFMIVFAGTVAVNVGTLVVLVSPSGPPMLSELLNAFF